MRIGTIGTLFGIVMAACLPACGGGGDSSGSLTVRWVVGGTSCDAAGVSTVKIHLLENDLDVLPPPDPTATCVVGTDGLTLAKVPTGTFTLKIEGLDAQGNAFYEGTRDAVKVYSDKLTTVDPPVTMSMKKAAVNLTWRFANGKMCPANGVSKVELGVFDQGSSEVLNLQFPCGDGLALIEGLRGNDKLNFNLFGVDAQGKRSFKGKAEVTPEPGKTADLEIVLAPCFGPTECN
jgi:hypothetical protein